MLNTPYTVLIILVLAMALFIWGHWRYDVVALIALAASVVTGVVPFNKIYTGLSNSAVITVACVMIISQALNRTGLITQFIRKISTWIKTPLLHVAALTLIIAFLSAFMNNVGALAIMMPIAIRTAVDNKRSPSFILMPISLGSAMGGLTTLIGTPPNLLVSSFRESTLTQGYAMFDFSYVGLWTALAGILFIIFLGWRLIPSERKAPKPVEDLFQMQDYITEIKIPRNSPVIDKTVRELEQMIKGDFVILGMIRKKRKRLVLRSDQTLQENDILIIEISAEDLEELLRVSKLKLVQEKKFSSDILRSDDVTLIEAVVPQASRLEGRSAESLKLRYRYQMNVLAIAREGRPFTKRLQQEPFRAGDIVLLQGVTESLLENTASLGFLPLSERDIQVGRIGQAYLPFLIFIFAIILAALLIVPVEVAFGGAVIAMVLLNSIPIRNLYDSVDWSIIVLLAAMIPIGKALQSTGGSDVISQHLLFISHHVSPIIVLILLLIITMTLSDFMNNAATAVVMAPIAVSIAKALNVHVDPFLMTVAIGASCSFLTPIGHQNNALIMGPGGYKFYDYARVGLPLELIILVTAIPLLLFFWPLH